MVRGGACWDGSGERDRDRFGERNEKWVKDGLFFFICARFSRFFFFVLKEVEEWGQTYYDQFLFNSKNFS